MGDNVEHVSAPASFNTFDARSIVPTFAFVGGLQGTDPTNLKEPVILHACFPLGVSTMNLTRLTRVSSRPILGLPIILVETAVPRSRYE